MSLETTFLPPTVWLDFTSAYIRTLAPRNAISEEEQGVMAEQLARKRAAKPKTRSGCVTCKRRRVKCDETKPRCNRCKRFGTECEGYSDVSAPVRRKPAVILPWNKKSMLLPKLDRGREQPVVVHKSAGVSVWSYRGHELDRHSNEPTFIYSQPSIDLLFQADSEYAYFTAFKERAAPELSGYFDTKVWNRTILQMCHQEDFARHAVIALGALHTTMEMVQNADEPPSTEKQRRLGQNHHQVALQYYGKALELLRRQPQHTPGLRVILLSCLLTTCFENYIGNQDNALAAAQKGVEVLNEHVASIDWCNTVEDLAKMRNFTQLLDDDDNDLLSTFARLGASIIMFDNYRRAKRKILPLQLVRLPPFPELPVRFRNVREARMYCDMLTKKALMWKDANLHRESFSNFDFGEPDPSFQAIKREQFAKRAQAEFQDCVRGKAQWRVAFQSTFQASRMHAGSKDFLGASILMIQYVTSQLMTHLPGQNYETYYDKFHDNSVLVIDLAEQLLERYPVTRSKKAIYTFDDGVIHGLFLVAYRCRDGTARRRAIQLLVKHPRREGLWDSAMAATTVSWLINQEEEGLVNGFVPEAARLRIVKLDPRLAERKVILRCSKLDNGLRERVELSEVTLTW
ncbi:uncharacterized protein PAC_05304 [Phialocephala subalpina]|uniref:Zn(2)-C6 fungal-type domain-containing protein n=1 Tax=Phialocephala subalpina TaxID=576137 RepID=A0A1L7WRM6_9HELO|nr:uncharacterized protein PAC_05304 [Phialocephala subalpina]